MQDRTNISFWIHSFVRKIWATLGRNDQATKNSGPKTAVRLLKTRGKGQSANHGNTYREGWEDVPVRPPDRRAPERWAEQTTPVYLREDWEGFSPTFRPWGSQDCKGTERTAGSQTNFHSGLLPQWLKLRRLSLSCRNQLGAQNKHPRALQRSSLVCSGAAFRGGRARGP